MIYCYPLRLLASLHETIWGGRRLERDGWKQLPPGNVIIGESWETEISNVIQNGPYAGKTLGTLVEELGVPLLGEQAAQSLLNASRCWPNSSMPTQTSLYRSIPKTAMPPAMKVGNWGKRSFGIFSLQNQKLPLSTASKLRPTEQR